MAQISPNIVIKDFSLGDIPEIRFRMYLNNPQRPIILPHLFAATVRVCRNMADNLMQNTSEGIVNHAEDAKMLLDIPSRMNNVVYCYMLYI